MKRKTNEPKFTPGLWHAVDSPTGATRSIYAGKIPICSMAMTDFYGVPEKEKLANASLIAAAPEMYGLLERIKTRLEWCELEKQIDDDLEHEIGAILTKARVEDGK